MHTTFPVVHRLAFFKVTLLSLGPLLTGADMARADRWEARSPVPGARAAHSAVWTGRELILWGGGIDGFFLNTGGRYVAATDTWRPTAIEGAPAPRWLHAAVWTGREMIIWGGRANFDGFNNDNDGALYNPETDTWRPMSPQGAPSPRSQCAAVWTGREMIVWGGATDTGTDVPCGGLDGHGDDGLGRAGHCWDDAQFGGASASGHRAVDGDDAGGRSG